MKVALVCEDVHKRGGTERVVYELATRLSLRHDVHVYAAEVEDLDAYRITWHRVPVPDLPTLAQVPLFAALSTIMIRREAFDAVIGQGINTLYADYMVVHTVNAARREIFHRLVRNGVRFGFARRVGEEVWYEFACSVEKRLLRRKSLSVVGVSSGVAREVLNYYPDIKSDRLKLVCNGVDCDEFNDQDRSEAHAYLRAVLELAPHSLLLLFVGGLWWLKGLSHVIEALRCLPNHCHLVVVGKGPEAEYTAHAEAAGVGGRVHFLGTRRDMPTIYRGADAFVLPSYYETFSLVTLEAMASGLPVFVSRFNGPSDYLRDGVNGFYVERDGRDIAAKVGLVFADEKRRRDMGRNARATALQFSWARAAATVEGIIKEDLANGRL